MKTHTPIASAFRQAASDSMKNICDARFKVREAIQLSDPATVAYYEKQVKAWQNCYAREINNAEYYEKLGW